MNPTPMTPEDFDELDDLLDDLRTRYDETPQWEFCEGFMAAVICCRRNIEPAEYFDHLLDIELVTPFASTSGGSFANAMQQDRFLQLWGQRWQEISTALNADVQSLEDDAAYHPEILDVRGAIAALSETERLAMKDQSLPAYGQVWALGFMFAVEAWPEEWSTPRNKAHAKVLDACLQAIVAMTEDDTDEATVAVFNEDGPASVSVQRVNHFADAIWAVYDLFELWKNIGPRVETVRIAATLGRNDLCDCGSGKKYKKCHGA